MTTETGTNWPCHVSTGLQFSTQVIVQGPDTTATVKLPTCSQETVQTNQYFRVGSGKFAELQCQEGPSFAIDPELRGQAYQVASRDRPGTAGLGPTWFGQAAPPIQIRNLKLKFDWGTASANPCILMCC
jgi:hypothetical protein